MGEIGKLIEDIVNNGLLPNPITFTAQILATLILFLVLKHFVWQPMQEFLDKRSNVIVDELNSAKSAREEAERMKDEYHQDLKDAKHEANDILENARKQAQEVKEQIIRDAEKEAEYKKEKAQKDIASERAKMEAKMKSQIVDIALAAAEKLVDKNLDDKNNRKLVDEFIDEVQ